MAWYMSKTTVNFPINLERIYHPMRGNWVARFDYNIDDEVFIINKDDSVSINNSDLNLTYVGMVRSRVVDTTVIHMIVTGRGMNNSSSPAPMQSIKKSARAIATEMYSGINDKPSEMLAMATELSANSIAATSVGWANDMYKEEFPSQRTAELKIQMAELDAKYLNWITSMSHGELQQLEKLQIAVAQNAQGTVVLGPSPVKLEIDEYKTKAISVGVNYIEIPLEKFDQMYYNIRAIEYTTETTTIWL